MPADTYEGRLHARIRTDALERNIMELPHRGYAFGGDLYYGHRANWRRWGGGSFGFADAESERTYLMGSVFAVAAMGVPFVYSERHRLIVSGYAGIGKDLDRFSTFRLPGRPTGYEWEALSLPMLPSVAFNELFPRRYGIAHVEYRYEPIFFLFPYVRASWGIVEQPRFQARFASRWIRCRHWAVGSSPAAPGARRSNSTTVTTSASTATVGATNRRPVATACLSSGRRSCDEEPYRYDFF